MPYVEPMNIKEAMANEYWILSMEV